MPITLRARPTCHYCGKRNSPSNTQRKFTCQYCQADNYLDESGQITDVPASVAASSRQYAVPRTPAFEIPEGSLFCPTCLKNQYMYNAALAEYLPDPDDPEYDRFEAAIPAFKEDLERRFPTCCARCEPKVKAQLQQATYNARSDHVRRVLDRSRQRRIANRLGWRSLIVNAAGLGWFTSLLTQLVWHALGSQTLGQLDIPDLHPTKCFITWPVPAQCSSIAESLTGPGLLLGVLSIWWNPKWQHKLEGREGRLVGLDRFYKVQCVLLAVRFASWTVIRDIPNITKVSPAVHAVSLVLITMIAGWSCFGIIDIYMPRIVDWSQDPAPLLDKEQYIPPLSSQDISPPNSQQTVPVSIFNTSVTPAAPQPWRPPTPPTDEDAMEWDPTPAAFSPIPRKVKYTSSEPSPFQGTLPAFPRGGVYNARNEPAVEQPKAIGLPPGFFDKSMGQALNDRTSTTAGGMGLAQPKFFPNVARADTGLENIFEKVFSLQDGAVMPNRGPNVTRPSTNAAPHAPNPNQSVPSKFATWAAIVRIYKIVAAAALAAYIAYFSAQNYLEQPSTPFALDWSAFSGLTSIPALGLIAELLPSERTMTKKPSATKVIVLLLDSIGLLVLYITKPDTQSLLLPFWNKLAIAVLASLFVQQVYDVCLEDGSSSGGYDGTAVETKDIILQPSVKPLPQLPLAETSSQGLRRTLSDESLASATSVATTTSTASGWKTPVKNYREELSNVSGSTSYGMGGLSLKNDHGFGVGSGIAGPRARQTPARGHQRGW